MGILVVICSSLLLTAFVQPHLAPDTGKALVAFSLFVTAVVFTVAAIANNNLQDLKTGQLVDATPWKPQAALMVGVIAGAAVIPPVLDLVNQACGFLGAPGVNPATALPTPQAGLISALAQGVIQGNIDWSLIWMGALIGAGVIVIDEVLARVSRLRLPPLAVGLGTYLPTVSTLMVVVGSIVGWVYERQADRGPLAEPVKQLGVLLASGLIVGESIIGVVIAAIVAFADELGLDKDGPLALVGPGFADYAVWFGGGAFAIVRWCCTAGLAGWAGQGRKLPEGIGGARWRPPIPS